MRDRAVWVTMALLIGFLGSGPGRAQEVTNLLQNAGFETGALAPWGSYGSAVATVTSTVVKDCVDAAVPEGPIEGSYCLNVKVSGPGTNYWDGAVSPVLVAGQGRFEQGKKYTLSLFFKCKNGTATIHLKPQLAQDPWTGYGNAQVTATEKWTEFHITTPVMAATVSPANITFHVLFKAQEFWIDDVKWYEGDYVPTVVKNKFGAQNPTPEAGAADVPRETALSWKPGPFAATHEVYFGDSFDDVNEATAANPLGTQTSLERTEATFDPAGPLEFEKTYYWRVDEVNAPAAPATYKGTVWSFTTEPYSYPLTGVRATAGSSNPGMGPEKTVDGSGLSADGRHSSTDIDMWLSAPGQGLPTWIQYEFGQVYQLDNMTVWNQNQKVETIVGFGARGVTIEYSLDGVNWSTVGDFELAQASGADGYAGETIDLAGLEARFVRLTIQSNWGGFIPQAGLSEVRFTYVPTKARPFAPALGAEEQPLDPVLIWRPGREAVAHDVYFSDNVQALTDGTAPVESVSTNKYQPEGLEYGKTYYWKVDELGEADLWAGDVWSFSTTEFAAVDDMESYNDDDNRIYDAWIDGWVNNTGSQVGYDAAPFAERSVVHAGRQSMPLHYDNTATPFLSEAEYTFGSARDWTAHGADTLWLYFRGAGQAEGSPAESLYVTVKDSAGKSKTVTNPSVLTVAAAAGWQEWKIPLSEFNSAGVKVTTVKAVTIGVGNKTSPAKGGTGLVYIDDIRIGRHGSSDPGAGVAYYALENDVLDGSGNGHDGVAFGNPTFVDGPAGFGKALQFNGAGGQYVSLGNWNPSAATGQLSVSLWARWAGLTSFYQGLVGKRDTWADGQTMWQIEASQSTGALSFSRYNITGATAPVLTVGEWTHIALTFDQSKAQFYINGVKTGTTGTAGFTLGPDTEAGMAFGACEGAGGNPFNGALDEVRIYDRPLSAFEVSFLAGR